MLVERRPQPRAVRTCNSGISLMFNTQVFRSLCARYLFGAAPVAASAADYSREAEYVDHHGGARGQDIQADLSGSRQRLQVTAVHEGVFAPGLHPMSLTAYLLIDDEGVLEAISFALEVDGIRTIAIRSISDPVLPRSQICACLVIDLGPGQRSLIKIVPDLQAANISIPIILLVSSRSRTWGRLVKSWPVTLVEKPLTGDSLSKAIREIWNEIGS